jgi:predicted metal-dependent phosphoesterase TrpH
MTGPSFAAARERYGDELLEHAWYDPRTFQTGQRHTMTPPAYLVELCASGRVTAVEMHSHTPRSDGWVEPRDIAAWTHALHGRGYFRHGHLAVPLVVMLTDHDYLYASHDLAAIPYEAGLTFLPAAEVSTAHGHVLYYGDHPEVVHALELSRPGLARMPDALEFFEMVRAPGGGVAVPAHPYREGHVFRTLHDDGIAAAFCAVEVINAKTAAEQNRAAIQYARRHGLRGIAGSDAHQISRLFSYLTLFDGPIHTVADLVTALREGDYFPVHGEHLRFTRP